MRQRIGGIDRDIVLADPVLADQRLGQAVGVVHIIEAKAALDAEPVVVGGPVLPLDRDDVVVPDLVGQLAADAAIGTDALDLAVGLVAKDAVLVDQARRHQGARRAGLHAFAAGDASRAAHRVVEIEHDLLAVTAPGHADNVIDLDLAAGAYAQIAVDAGVELHRHRRMAAVGRWRQAARETARADLDRVRPLPEPRLRVMCRGALGLVADQQFEHELARRFGALACRLHFHAWSRPPDAGGRQHPLPLDLDHAGAAIAVGPIARLWQPAEMRDLDAVALRHLPDRLARLRLDFGAVQRKPNRISHRRPTLSYALQPLDEVVDLGLRPG